MKYFAGEILILLDIILLISATSDTAFEEDFVHSFLIKSDKLRKSERLKTAGEEFLVKTAYKVIFIFALLVWGENNFIIVPSKFSRFTMFNNLNFV